VPNQTFVLETVSQRAPVALMKRFGRLAGWLASRQSTVALPRHDSKRRRCHNVVTTRCESGDSTGDSKRRFVLVSQLRDTLQNNEIQPMSDWGSSGRRF
jgi:hypothetical protein